MSLTELLLDDLKNLLLVKFLGETLNSGQSLTSITLCKHVSRVCASMKIPPTAVPSIHIIFPTTSGEIAV